MFKEGGACKKLVTEKYSKIFNADGLYKIPFLPLFLKYLFIAFNDTVLSLQFKAFGLNCGVSLETLRRRSKQIDWEIIVEKCWKSSLTTGRVILVQNFQLSSLHVTK